MITINLPNIMCSFEAIIVGISLICGVGMVILLFRIVVHAYTASQQNLEKITANRHKIEETVAELQSRVASTQFILSYFVGGVADELPNHVRHLH